MSPRDANPTAGEMITELLDLFTGFGTLVLPLIILAVPALILLLPLAALAIPVAIVAAPFLALSSVRRYGQPHHD